MRAPLISLAILLAAPPASAQELSARVVGASAYVFRGLTVTSRPVLQPSMELAAGPLMLGAWANVEPEAYDGEDEFSESAGDPGVTEVDLYAELSATRGALALTAGVSHYTYPNDEGSVPADNTTELYLGAELEDVPLTPSLFYYHDVDEVSGGYLELAVGRDVTFGPRSARMGAALGYSVSQAPAYFSENGFTHLDLSAASELEAGPFTLEPEIHLILHLDEATRAVSPLRERDARIWFGLGISWTGTLP
jgi:uncharacterized protein (TIGR02001 family)